MLKETEKMSFPVIYFIGKLLNVASVKSEKKMIIPSWLPGVVNFPHCQYLPII